MRSVAYSSNSLLECAPCNGEVILCLVDGLTLAGSPFLTARIATTDRVYDCIGGTSYIYGLTYDEALLIESYPQLTEADITGAFCKGCLTDWLDEQLSELEAQIIAAQVTISPDAGNIIELRANGLFAEIPEEPMYESYETLAPSAVPVAIKAAAGAVKGWYIYNSAATTRYVKLWDSAAAIDPSAGTDHPKVVLAIPKGQAANASMPAGIEFTTGIQISATTGQADTDETAQTAGDLTINIFYT